ncbi:MAG TPA: hypothetical protein VFX23_13320 [Limnobacter sp.]|uniref:hypothetical protein n=1 Tax=Limnobacter sp. TaxID=2003368 RepID=UPI002E31B667|nr:hypothetical protein [Limnobacter sp.]HEX5486966.1 hypothetical protein [Limnobacter sp.]
MATPFDQIKGGLNTLGANAGPLGAAFTTLADNLPSDFPAPPAPTLPGLPSGGLPDLGSLPQPPAFPAPSLPGLPSGGLPDLGSLPQPPAFPAPSLPGLPSGGLPDLGSLPQPPAFPAPSLPGLPSGGTPSAPPEAQPFIDIVQVPATTVADSLTAAGASLQAAGADYAARLQALGGGFGSSGAGFQTDLTNALTAGGATAAAQAQAFQDNATAFGTGLADTFGHYSAIGGDRVAFAVNAVTDNLSAGGDTLVSNFEMIAGAAQGGASSGNAVAQEVSDTLVAAAGGQAVFYDGAAGGQAIITGIADVLADSTIYQNVGDLAGSFSNGAQEVGNALSAAGLGLYNSGSGGFPPDTSGGAQAMVGFFGALTDAGVGPDGVFTHLGAAGAAVLSDAVDTAQVALGVLQAGSMTVSDGIATQVVPDAFSVPAAVLGQLGGQDPSGGIGMLQSGFEQYAPMAQDGAATIQGAITDGAATGFGQIQAGLDGAPGQFSGGFDQVTGGLHTAFSTIADGISGASFPPAGAPAIPGAPDLPALPLDPGMLPVPGSLPSAPSGIPGGFDPTTAATMIQTAISSGATQVQDGLHAIPVIGSQLP